MTIRVLVSSDRIGGIFFGLSPALAALAGDIATGHVAGNQLRGHRAGSIGREPGSRRLWRTAVGRRGVAVSPKSSAVGDRKRRSGAASGLFVFGGQMATPCGAAKAVARAAGARDSGSGIGVRAACWASRLRLGPNSSLPGLTRQSISFARLCRRLMDARVKPAYDSCSLSPDLSQPHILQPPGEPAG